MKFTFTFERQETRISVTRYVKDINEPLGLKKLEEALATKGWALVRAEY